MANFTNKNLNYGICDVQENYNFYFNYLLGKVNNMFIWHNLPETIPPTVLNTQLILNGSTCFTKIKGKLYALYGNFGGEPDENYLPTQYIISNPILGSKTAQIRPLRNKKPDSVIMYNTEVDSIFPNLPNSSGLFQLIKQTATLLADNIVSISCAQINSRVQAVHTAESEAQARTAEKVIKDMYQGKPYKVITGDELEKFTVQNIENRSAADIIAQLVELQQYILGQFYMAIGIKYNSVNKKERLITDEINFQDQYLNVNKETLLTARQTACNAINQMFDTNISVEINGVYSSESEGDDNIRNKLSDDNSRSNNGNIPIQEVNNNELAANSGLPKRNNNDGRGDSPPKNVDKSNNRDEKRDEKRKKESDDE